MLHLREGHMPRTVCGLIVHAVPTVRDPEYMMTYGQCPECYRAARLALLRTEAAALRAEASKCPNTMA